MAFSCVYSEEQQQEIEFWKKNKSKEIGNGKHTSLSCSHV